MATDPDDTDMRYSAADGRYSGFDRDGPDEPGEPPPRFGRLALCLAAAGALTFGVMGTVAYGVWFNEDQQTYADAIAGAREALGSSASGKVPTVAVAHAPDDAAAQSAAQSPAESATPSATRSATQSATQFPAQSPTQLAAQPKPPSVALDATGANGGFEDTNPAVWSGKIHPSSPDPSLATTLADTSIDDAADTSVGTSGDTPLAPVAPTPPPRSPKHTANAADSNAHPAAGRGAKETRLAQQERRASSKHKDDLFARIGQFFRRVSYRQHDNGRQQQDTYSHP